jgi:DNA primase
MQKNLPEAAPPWIRFVTLWAESSHREVRYALCDDWRTLLWFANQRAVEYHPTLVLAGQKDRPTQVILDIDPPEGGPFGQAVAAAFLVRQALVDAGLAGAVHTAGRRSPPRRRSPLPQWSHFFTDLRLRQGRPSLLKPHRA